MCQGIPRRVLEAAPGRARVDFDGEPRWVLANERLGALEVGDHVVVYAGVALERVSAEEALEQLRFLRELEQMFPSSELPGDPGQMLGVPPDRSADLPARGPSHA